MSSNDSIAVIGAGTMGANIALDLAAHGNAVWLVDRNTAQLAGAMGLIGKNAEFLRRNALTPDDPGLIRQRITVGTDLAAAVKAATWVVEAVPEDLALKHQVFTAIEAHAAPGTPLTSNTSTFQPSLLAADLRHPERMLVTHYWNPAHLIPLVEVVPHAGVDSAVLETVMLRLKQCGKQAVIVRREVPGFIGNRLAFALQREAMALVDQGVASPEEIDLVVKTGFGRRVAETGVFGTADLGGLDVYLAICQMLFPDLSTTPQPSALLEGLVREGRLGMKSGAGWREYTVGEVQAVRERLSQALVAYARRDQDLTG